MTALKRNGKLLSVTNLSRMCIICVAMLFLQTIGWFRWVPLQPNLWSSVFGDTESPLRRCKPSPSTSPWPDVHLPNFVTIRLRQSVNTSLFTLWVVVCQHQIAGSDTSQIPSDVFFSYNNGVFTLHSVYFSVTFTKSKQKKVKQTTFMYKYDHLRSLVRHLFFFVLLCDTHQPTENYKCSRVRRSNCVTTQ